MEEEATTTTTTKETPIKEEPEPTSVPENSEVKEESTEVHVVTSINQEIQVDSGSTATTQTTTSATTTTVRPSHVKKISIPEVSSLDTSITTPGGQSYQYISIGTPRPTQDNVLELEKLFLNEKLQLSSDPVKKKRKVASSSISKPGFLERPVRVDSSITVVSDLYPKNTSKSRAPIVKSLPSIFLPSTPPPASYVAPTQPYFQIDNDEEFIILNNSDQDHPKSVVDLDDLIVENVEKILRIKVPNDPQLRHRGVSKSSANEDMVSRNNYFLHRNILTRKS